MSIGGTSKAVKLSADVLRLIEKECMEARHKTPEPSPEMLAIGVEVVKHCGGRVILRRILETVLKRKVNRTETEVVLCAAKKRLQGAQ